MAMFEGTVQFSGFLRDYGSFDHWRVNRELVEVSRKQKR